MKRYHLIEIEDQEWCPKFIRDALTDYLQFTISLGKVYHPIADRLGNTIKTLNVKHIVDLCSGGSGPWKELKEELENRLGHSLKISLSDKYPNLEAFERVAKESNGEISFYKHSIDATEFSTNERVFRTIFSALHHFQGDMVKKILSDAINNKQGIGVFELTERRLPVLIMMLIVPFFVLLFTPFIKPFRLSRIFFTYFVPIIPLLVGFDGFVSCLRTYTVEELKQLVNEIDNSDSFAWDIGQEAFKGNPAQITYLIGYPKIDDDQI